MIVHVRRGCEHLGLGEQALALHVRAVEGKTTGPIRNGATTEVTPWSDRVDTVVSQTAVASSIQASVGEAALVPLPMRNQRDDSTVG